MQINRLRSIFASTILFGLLSCWLMILYNFGCEKDAALSKSAAQKKSQNNTTGIIEPGKSIKYRGGLLDTNLPTSRFVSRQKLENLRPATANKGGFDPDYKMLNFRRLEDIEPNDNIPFGRKVEGVRNGARVILKPLAMGTTKNDPKNKDEIDSQELINVFFEFMDDPAAKWPRTLAKIQKIREDLISKLGPRPTVLVSGLGPVGLLTVLEAYSRGSNIIAIEKRSQYTRPQILRLTSETIDRVAYFIGGDLWKYLRVRGVVSKSPNWAQNKFDVHNEFLYSAAKPAQFTPAEKALLQQYENKDLELENVDILRINHLETILAAVVERIAVSDPDHVRVYYGTTLKTSLNPKLQLDMEIASSGLTKNYPISSVDIISVTEGAQSEIATTLKLKSDVISQKLYGSTVALRLPEGFDIGLRPVENREGTASVKGIAIIDQEKLTAPGTTITGFKTNREYSWTMIAEQKLCEELNEVLQETASLTMMPNPKIGILLPCNTTSELLGAEWKKINGGQNYYIPRTRYFFTGGIAYLGVELTSHQYTMFQKRNDPSQSQAIRDAARLGHKKFMILAAKKHMPQEYISGNAQSIANEALSDSAEDADRARVIMITEAAYSLTSFPIELRKAQTFSSTFTMNNNEEVRVLLGGDTFATTHFFTGSGAVNGLFFAILLGTALEQGANEKDFVKTAHELSLATDAMHNKVMKGQGNAPLDGPFNEPLAMP